jgi:hypothetical protein
MAAWRLQDRVVIVTEGALVLLASEEGAFMTGQTYVIEAGPLFL